MRKLAIALTLLIGAGFLPASAELSCYPAPEQICADAPIPMGDAPSQANVVALQNSFQQSNVVVQMGGNIFFQNFDDVDHTITDVGCTDSTGRTKCTFSKSLVVGARLRKAVSLVISPHDFTTRTYSYVCTVHDGMRGTFTVV